MRYAILVTIVALVPAYAQVVKPTAGALAPVNSAPNPASAAPTAAPTIGSIGKTGNTRDVFKRLESDFDYGLKTADQSNPMDILGMTRGLYVEGVGAIFTTEVDLARSDVLPMFVTKITNETKTTTHNRKVKNLAILRQQMGKMMTASAKTVELGPTEQMVLAVRLLYQAWEDKTGLPDQIVMKADRRGILNGDIKVDVQ